MNKLFDNFLCNKGETRFLGFYLYIVSLVVLTKNSFAGVGGFVSTCFVYFIIYVVGLVGLVTPYVNSYLYNGR